ncbi:BEN domain-containing protein 7 [Cheilinus undulatus]|uniref:BEN domain-containing protein 7 n=1 Tax=Cheilinus undulatus TaxID=241271 RepID=UPI001BD34E6C|nr:BEN domain-containing protein 7 [Cheilinus undulatus]
MEFGERKRRRKSQSFKLVTDEDSSFTMNLSRKDANREPMDAAAPEVWVGDEGMEIKKQITGMMRLLSDKTSRFYQRVGAEQDSFTKETQDGHLSWVQQSAALSEERHSNSWSSTEEPGPSLSSIPTSSHNGSSCVYSTRSKATRNLHNSTKDPVKEHEYNDFPADVAPPAEPETPCCMCNCKGTLQAILQELRSMRKLMQTQRVYERQEQAAPPCLPRLGQGPAPRCRPRKRRPIYKVAPLTVSNSRKAAPAPPEASVYVAVPAEADYREGCEKEQKSSPPNSHPVCSEVSVLPSHNDPVTPNKTHNALLNPAKEPQLLESEVRLAEDYDVYISKAQLDSILVNYTRSGSLLFRKLVCAFFDDATLANSLPNGKRKRGLNDNRKGLDQNIVGAIKVFTEKYCTEHRIEKLPGPRDWVQILQDQIKLARRRLKRDGVEAEEVINGPSTTCNFSRPAGVEVTVNMTG